jgi:hypothetical protein
MALLDSIVVPSSSQTEGITLGSTPLMKRIAGKGRKALEVMALGRNQPG